MFEPRTYGVRPSLSRSRSARAVDRRLEQTIASKVTGYANVLVALDASALKEIVAFGSVIVRTGLTGEAHYALANELLGRTVERTRREQAACRYAVLEWSEVGMAGSDASTR
jgi:enediyne polyketide synthase